MAGMLIRDLLSDGRFTADNMRIVAGAEDTLSPLQLETSNSPANPVAWFHNALLPRTGAITENVAKALQPESLV